MNFKKLLPKQYGFLFNATIIVAALGYFVDVFDLALFSVVRTPSLLDLGLEGEELTKAGLHLLNMQMFGMLVGGIFWGILGDKKGRLSVLFGSILLYSVGNIANAFVHDVSAYALCRLISGIGLAGELGAGITLVAEMLPKDKRSLGTMVVASVGVAGAVASGLIGDIFPWRTAYLIGGFMGIALLIARGMVFESTMFQKSKSASRVKRGRFLSLFTNWKRFRYYAACILMGVPVWYLVGILVTLSPEIGKQMGIEEPIKASYAVMAYSIAITLGDVASGIISHVMKTRKKVILAFLIAQAVSIYLFFTIPMTATLMYVMYGVMGFFIGIWAVLITTAAELFGTNMRATTTSTVPNFIRGSTIFLNMAVAALGGYGLLTAIQVVGAVVMGLAILAATMIPETYHRDLDFDEQI